ncbi:MAG: ATP-binding protein [Candidatus Hydrogenedentes bacterium]|nr:ATP-binding protein [Candidatus Hydrogenedentota bacterium]
MNTEVQKRRIDSAGFAFEVESRLALVDDICVTARELLGRHGLEHVQFDVDLLLREFIVNGMEHGNGLDGKKKVAVDFRIGPKWIVVRIQDEGPGFRWRTLSRTPPEEVSTSGRGLAIGALYAHRVRFNNAGNQVTLWISKTTKKESEGL